MKNFKFILLIIIGAVCFTGRMNAQEKTIIRGTVTDAKDKSTLPGVSVAELDKDDRFITVIASDMNGNYAIKVSNPNNRLMFSFIGYNKEVVSMGGQSTINVKLTENVIQLEGIEIVAKKSNSNGMMEIDARDLTSSISKIDARELAEIPATSIDEALQGRLAGVDITAASGDPGMGMAIRIRGTSSLTSGSDPLIVVDGMPYNANISSDFDFGIADEQAYSQLLSIAPEDISEISVLKDAAATAVWGARASNGVLLVTTKRGAKGKPVVNLSFKGSISKQPKTIPMLSGPQYTTLMEEAYMNANGLPMPLESLKEFANDPNDPYYYYNYGQNTNWVDAITQTGNIKDYGLSVSGGGDKTRYRASVDYNGQKGTTIGTAYNRLSARINLDFIVSKRIKFQTDLSYTYANNDRNYVNTKDNVDNIRALAYIKMPNMSIYEYDINGNKTSNYFTPISNAQGSWPKTYNPVALANEGKNNIIDGVVIPKFSLQYDIVPSFLKFTTDIGFNIDNYKNTQFLPRTATGVDVTNSSANVSTNYDSDKFNVQTINKLLITPKLGEKNTLFGLLMFTTNDYRESTVISTTSNSASSELQDPSIPSLTSTSTASMQSGNSQNRAVGALADIQYSLMDRYIINAGVRMDGSSKFGPNHRYGYFPSISGRWRVSGESFMKSLTFINDFSIKASYGSSGNSPKDSYGYFSNYSTFPSSYLGTTGVYPASMKLTNLKWETVVQSDFGFILQMFQNRLTMDLDFYKKRTKDMIFPNLSISSITGFNNVTMNSGTMDNQGWEFNIDATIVKTKDWSVRFNFNVAKNDNIIRSISEFYPTESGDMSRNGQYYIHIQPNNPFGSFYGYKYKGVYKDADATIARDKDGYKIYDPLGNPIPMRFYYPSNGYTFQPGDAQYEDINHDGNIDYKDVVLLGDANPRYTGGFGPSVAYKGWRLSTFFHYRIGDDVVNSTRMNTENMYYYNNQSTAVLKRWRQEGDQTDMPRAMIQQGYNWLGSDRYVEDGSFLRFKTITLSYKFIQGIPTLGLKGLNIYFTLQNIYTWTKYKGQDPEVSVKVAPDKPFSIGYDNSMTPPVKSFTVGLDMQF